MNFAAIDYINYGQMAVPMPSTVYNDNVVGIVWRAQNPCVLKLSFPVNTDTSYCVVTTTIGGESVQVTVEMNVSKILYIPLNETFLSLLNRPQNASFGLSGSTGTITVEAYNSLGVLLDTISKNITVCDSGGVPPADENNAHAHVLPDTFLWPSPSAYRRYCYITARMLAGIDQLKVKNGSGVVLASYTRTDSDTASVSRHALTLVNPAVVEALDGGAVKEIARVILQSMCYGQQVLLTWWSPVDGGWKARIADVMALNGGVTNTVSYTRMFDRREGKDAEGGMSCRFPKLSSRDWCYYRDIMFSDEVYLVTGAQTFSGNDIERVPVIVRGDLAPKTRNVDIDIDFDIVFTHYTEI